MKKPMFSVSGKRVFKSGVVRVVDSEDFEPMRKQLPDNATRRAKRKARKSQ